MREWPEKLNKNCMKKFFICWFSLRLLNCFRHFDVRLAFFSIFQREFLWWKNWGRKVLINFQDTDRELPGSIDRKSMGVKFALTTRTSIQNWHRKVRIYIKSQNNVLILAKSHNSSPSNNLKSLCILIHLEFIAPTLTAF